MTRAEISRALVEERYYIRHFIGHGVFKDEQSYLVINSEKEIRFFVRAA